MPKKTEKRGRITLKCTVCGEKNYRTEKSKANTPSVLVVSKYCRNCKKHTEHKEEK